MTRDQFITEEVLKECWHELPKEGVALPFVNGMAILRCIKCGSDNYNNPDFSTPADAYRLMQFAMGAEWFARFLDYAFWHEEPQEAGQAEDGYYNSDFIVWLFSDPDRLANLVSEYRGWKV